MRWQESEAKYLLRKDIIAGAVTADDDPVVVFNSRPEYQPFEAKFAEYLTNLLEKVAEEQAFADLGSQALANDLRLHPPANDPRGYPIFGGSEAERLLKQDMDNDLHKQFKPRELHVQREEYQAWPLEVFRNHIHQELRTRIEGRYWKQYKDSKRGWKKT